MAGWMRVELRPIRIETGSPDEVGRLALAGGKLVALLVRLEASHDERAGYWSIEWLAGSALTYPPPFPDLEAASRWLSHHLAPVRMFA